MEKGVDEMTNLEKLKELTDKLPVLSDLLSFKPETSVKREYVISQGFCYSWNLFSDEINKVTVDRWHVGKDALFSSHSHNENELIFVYKGCIALVGEEMDEILLKAGDYIFIPANTRHGAEYPEETLAITILYPIDKYIALNNDGK